MPADVETLAVQLPGRETRLRERPMNNIGAIADEVALRIAPLLDRPFAFFGHSMGALVAFETAKRLGLAGKTAAMLFVSGREAPHLSLDRERFEDLPDDEFIGAMDRKYGGVPALLKEDQEFRDLYLPPLRADVAAVTQYRHAGGPPLTCPIHVLGGVSDCSAPAESLSAWEQHTTDRCTVHLFPGGHFYVNTARAAVVGAVATELSRSSGVAADRRCG
jgi:medium-chain acyl-[acyl-carrier-protein] hydrolase